MNAVQVESSSPRHRTQAFIATSSPDELCGKIINALCPKYNIDRPDILLLRQLIRDVIVVPRPPPALKRTRPDRHLGELVAAPIYSSSRGVDGPPLSANQSFYFSHRDPNFATLLPQVDRSRYRRAGKQTSHSDLNGGNAQDSQERYGTAVPDAPATISAQSAVSTRAPISLAPLYAEPNLEETHLDRTLDGPADSDATVVLKSSQKSALKGDAHNYPSKQVHFSPKATEVTTEVPKVEPAANSHESSAVSTSSQQINMIMGSVRLGQNKHIRFTEDTINPTPSTLQPLDTQDTQDSTQQSDVFSSSGSFADFTPPTQESLDDTSSQTDTPDFSQELSANSEEPESGSSKKEEPASSKTPEPSSSKKAEAVSSEEAVSLQEQSSQNVPTPVLGKRAHDASETSDDMPQHKRSKRSKQSMRSKHSKLPRHSMRLRSAH